MSHKICELCNRLFQGGDEVKAVIITRYVALKSDITYALEKPSECIEIIHRNCQHPQGMTQDE